MQRRNLNLIGCSRLPLFRVCGSCRGCRSCQRAEVEKFSRLCRMEDSEDGSTPRDWSHWSSASDITTLRHSLQHHLRGESKRVLILEWTSPLKDPSVYFRCLEHSLHKDWEQEETMSITVHQDKVWLQSVSFFSEWKEVAVTLQNNVTYSDCWLWTI